MSHVSHRATLRMRNILSKSKAAKNDHERKHENKIQKQIAGNLCAEPNG